MFNSLLEKDRHGIIINSYRDKRTLKPALKQYIYAIKNKHVAVIGTEIPWAEAILINLGAHKITTIEYREITIEHSQVETITPFKFAEQFLSRKSDTFDTIFSYSSIEHSGLGRYGDPLMPHGDLEALAQIWCAAKPNGYLFLALPMSKDRRECVVHFNAHRQYGYKRMQHLTANWKVLNEIHLMEGHFLYVLQKLE